MSDLSLLWHLFFIAHAAMILSTLFAYLWMLWHANDPPPDHDEP